MTEMAGSHTRPKRSRAGQLLLIALLAVAAVVLVDAFLFADLTPVSVLRPFVALGFGIALFLLVMGTVIVPPSAITGFGVLALVLSILSAVLAPPRGVEWLALLAMVAVPIGLIAWGMSLRRRRSIG